MQGITSLWKIVDLGSNCPITYMTIDNKSSFLNRNYFCPHMLVYKNQLPDLSADHWNIICTSKENTAKGIT